MRVTPLLEYGPRGSGTGKCKSYLQQHEAHAQRLLRAGAQQVQHEVDQVPVGGGVQQAAGGVKGGQAVARAGHDLGQLWQRVHEVEDLQAHGVGG